MTKGWTKATKRDVERAFPVGSRVSVAPAGWCGEVVGYVKKGGAWRLVWWVTVRWDLEPGNLSAIRRPKESDVLPVYLTKEKP